MTWYPIRLPGVSYTTKYEFKKHLKSTHIESDKNMAQIWNSIPFVAISNKQDMNMLKYIRLKVTVD